MSRWIIRDWMGHDVHLYDRKEFKNFADARAETDKFAHDICDSAVQAGKYTEDSQEYEEAHNGICEDLYAVNIDDNGNELPDTGQYTY